MRGWEGEMEVHCRKSYIVYLRGDETNIKQIERWYI